eukprot:g45174.t1
MTSSLATLRSKFTIPIKSKSARQCFLLRLVLCLSFVRYSLPSYLIAMPQFDLCLNNDIHREVVPVPTGHISPSIFVSIPVAPWPALIPECDCLVRLVDSEKSTDALALGGWAVSSRGSFEFQAAQPRAHPTECASSRPKHTTISTDKSLPLPAHHAAATIHNFGIFFFSLEKTKKNENWLLNRMALQFSPPPFPTSSARRDGRP